jgi:hypothetical protein
MAELNPLFLSSGSIRQMTSSLNTVVDYIHLPVTQSGSSGIFTTNLPDPYLFASQSVNVIVSQNNINQPIYKYDIPNRLENYFYTSNAIIGVSTTNAGIGVRIGLLRSQLANTAFNLKSPITLTSFTFANVTTLSNTTYVLPGSHPAINTIYPTHFKGFTSNILTSSTSSISNTYVVQSEGTSVVSASAGSIFYNQFVGYSSSFTPTSSIPIYFNSGSLNIASGSDTITPSFLPSTSSLWLSQSLETSVVSANTNYATVFTLTGLTTGQRYLVNLYMIGSSSTLVNPFRVRVVTGSQYNGTIWIPVTTNAPFIQNSANGDNITVGNPTQWPADNTGYLIYGEYTFVKGATDPQVQITANTTTYSISALPGSVIFYRPII